MSNLYCPVEGYAFNPKELKAYQKENELKEGPYCPYCGSRLEEGKHDQD